MVSCSVGEEGEVGVDDLGVEWEEGVSSVRLVKKTSASTSATPVNVCNDLNQPAKLHSFMPLTKSAVVQL
jgi:hypothetical protein